MITCDYDKRMALESLKKEGGGVVGGKDSILSKCIKEKLPEQIGPLSSTEPNTSRAIYPGY